MNVPRSALEEVCAAQLRLQLRFKRLRLTPPTRSYSSSAPRLLQNRTCATEQWLKSSHWRARRIETRSFQTGIARKASDHHKYHARKSERGPLAEYDARVQKGSLRDDSHQRSLVESLQDLHDMLEDYDQPKVIKPDPEKYLKDITASQSFFGRMFHSKPDTKTTEVPQNMPKGLYMYGDVGSGKTMLMDLFFDTLPPNIKSKKRIHFHNFMQEVHAKMHEFKQKYNYLSEGLGEGAGAGNIAILAVAAEFAERGGVLCFDEFQCTDVADAMILRRLLEALMKHGVVLVTTSNRHPDDLYKNGIQRESFIPCITLLKTRLRVLNLDSRTDYRSVPRPPSGVYHHPLDKAAETHAQKWFAYFADPDDPMHPATHEIWGRKIEVPRVSGKVAWFKFDELLGRATGAGDYIELCKHYDAFVVQDVPSMNYKSKDLARRFITFIDAVYESRAKLVITSETILSHIFISKEDMEEGLSAAHKAASSSSAKSPKKANLSKDEKEAVTASKLHTSPDEEHYDVDSAARLMMDDLGLSMAVMKSSGLFTGDEERFAFSRTLSRLSEMGSQEWVERGMDVKQPSPDADNESREAGKQIEQEKANAA